MVYHVAGRLGSGKTLYCVNRIVDAFLYGDQHIYTNIRLVDGWDFLFSKYRCRGVLSFLRFFLMPFNTLFDYRLWIAAGVASRYHYIPTLDAAVSACMALGAAPEGSRLFIWDEIHLDLNSRAWKSTNKDYIEFFSMSRKLGFDILMTSQLRGSVDRQMRELADVGYEFKNLKHLKPFGIPIIPVNVGLLVKRWANKGMDAVDSKTVFVGAGIVRYSSEVSNFYNTRQIVSEHDNSVPHLWSSGKEGGLCGRCHRNKFFIKYGNFVKEYGSEEIDYGLVNRFYEGGVDE